MNHSVISLSVVLGNFCLLKSLNWPARLVTKERHSHPINKDTKGVIESVRINWVSILSGLKIEKFVRAFFSQGQSKLSIKSTHLY